LTGGGRPVDPSLAAGLIIAPTVFDRVTPQMRIAREEIFGLEFLWRSADALIAQGKREEGERLLEGVSFRL